MKLSEILSSDEEIEEAKPTKDYCQKTPKSKMSASWEASCKSRGEISRDGGKSHKIGGKRVTVDGKKIPGEEYGGPLPDWS